MTWSLAVPNVMPRMTGLCALFDGLTNLTGLRRTTDERTYP